MSFPEMRSYVPLGIEMSGCELTEYEVSSIAASSCKIVRIPAARQAKLDIDAAAARLRVCRMRCGKFNYDNPSFCL